VYVYYRGDKVWYGLCLSLQGFSEISFGFKKGWAHSI